MLATQTLPRRRRPRGVALPDVLIVVVALALLAAVAVPELAAARQRSVQGVLRADLRRLSAAQESYFYDHHVYSADPADLQTTGFQPSPEVRIVINEATLGGWSATASRTGMPAQCYMFVRRAAPVGSATAPGEVRCS